MTPNNFRHAYAPSSCVQTDCTDWDDKTEQHHKEACDINNIMQRYHQTGVLNHFQQHGPEYGETSDVDFHAMMNTVTHVAQVFADLPAKARNHFGHDPQAMLEYMAQFNPDDPESYAELQALGLAPEHITVATQFERETSGEIPPPTPEMPNTAQSGEAEAVDPT